ncbi:hypothetical protein BASA50_005882 [Batrachochytrium salamandrivorans]|uniref:DNA-directed RNA polymerase subunit n=1 Tax=Batrachochytrium salamandrivorans TaxID=1357716 RepID=A0ABQ8FBH4_9FUNG|nr:hypothetical protein BASA50_005882 [Batrachochytrium salamandrivorans]KAH9267790.1 hypothetical protein BASA83_009729 [Batrachochytrium salamandrivorans]
MNISNPVSAEVYSVHFSFYNTKDIRKLSVKQITNPLIFDNLDHPTTHGLYDPALGPSGKDATCATCSLGYSSCPGHFGHIDLSVPVYNTINFKLMYKLLQSTCYYCHFLRTSRTVIHHFAAKLKLLHAGLIVDAAELDSAITMRSTVGPSSKKVTTGTGGKSSTSSKSGNKTSSDYIDDEAIEDDGDSNDEEDPDSLAALIVGEYNDGGDGVELPAVERDPIRVMAAIDEYVARAFSKNPDARPIKATLVTDSLRRLERQFMAAIPAHGCHNCRGQSPKFRKDGDAKIFERPLSAKQKHAMAARGLTVETLFGEITADDASTKKKSDSVNGPASNGSFSVLGIDPNSMESQREIYLTPLQVKAHIQLLWKKEAVILDLLYGNSSVKGSPRVSSPLMFFLDVVPVTPTRFRPISKLGDMQYEHPQNIHLTEIIKANITIQELQRQETEALKVLTGDPVLFQIRKAEYLKRIIDGWVLLQNSVNYLIDSSKAPLTVSGKTAPPGVRQLLEKKEGLFRKHMMGKRVNYAARSVISPDPYIETNEIGIPPVFAVKLTYPEPVTHHNVKEMRKCVINGPLIWPGATHVENEDGTLVSLGVFDDAGRTAIANQLLTPSMHHGEVNQSHRFIHTNKKVYRHLRNGDFLLLNRQPTLHKPSIMAHTARILPGEKTIRMHYANCNTYNADFDGDEMNIHFPQNDIARAEAMLIARTDQQYLVPTDGGVLRGLIQDHVDAGVDMCSRDTFFTRELYMQLVYSGLCPEGSVSSTVGNGNIETPIVIGRNGRVITLPPAIFKPTPRWTGKQIISTILTNLIPEDRDLLNLVSKSRIPAKQWGPSAPEEQTVLFMDGDLLTGILDKSQFGASANGLVHAVYEVYGASYAGKLLSILGRLFTTYLQYAGFTCRMDDLRLTPEGDSVRRELIDSASGIGLEAISEVTGVDATGIPQNKHTMYLSNTKGDHQTMSKVAELNIALEAVLRNNEKMAALDSAMKSRTNKVTSKIISACVPDKLLKPFPYNNMQVMTVSGAKGSGVNVSQISCLLGQQELEGKRVPTMVSGKTLPSFLAYDTSARSGGYITGRFLTGIKPQEYYFHCMAGREGLIDTAVKTSRSGYLQRCLIKHLEGLAVHYDHTVRDMDGSLLQFHYGEDALDVVKQTTLTNFDFCALNYRALLKRYDPSALAGKIDDESLDTYLKKQRKMDRQSLREGGEGAVSTLAKRDPIISIFSPSRHVGAVSDGFSDALEAYVNKNPSQLLATTASKKSQKEKRDDNGVERLIKDKWSVPRIASRKFKALMELKYMHSLVEPGEAVGLLAAQSIGEPSTQMTLNTFHFAGFGAKNVTLGIPRLREIIMTASSSIQTPLMKLPLKAGITVSQAEIVAHQVSRVVLSQIMQGVTVTETLTSKTAETQTRRKRIRVRLEFWPLDACRRQYNLTGDDIGAIIEAKFVPALDRAILRDLKSRVRKSGGAAEVDALAGDQDAIGVSLVRIDVNKNSRGISSGGSHEKNDQDNEEETFDGSAAGGNRSGSGGSRSKSSLSRGVVDAADLSDAEDDDSLDGSDDENGDGDATATRLSSKRLQQASYDAPDEEDEQVIGSINNADRLDDSDDENATPISSARLDRENQGDDDNESEDPIEEKDSEGLTREERIRNSSRFVCEYKFHKGNNQKCDLIYEFPADTKKILMLALVEDVCTRVVVREVPGVSRCYHLPNESENDKSVCVGTDGTNLQGMWEHDQFIDINNISTNDIAAVLRTYGIEAARAAIMKEIAGVFGVYGIQVDPRHLSIIADYMTFEGGYKPFNRTGMNSNPSPFLQMSFETTTNFLTTATLTGDLDPLDSPSARLVMGQVVKSGTGAFSVLQPLPNTA